MTARIRTHMFDFPDKFSFHRLTPTSKVFKNVFQLVLICLPAGCARLFPSQHFAENVFIKDTCDKGRQAQTHGHKLASKFKRDHVSSVWTGGPLTLTTYYQTMGYERRGASWSPVWCLLKCGCIFRISRVVGCCPGSLDKCYWFKLVPCFCSCGMSRAAAPHPFPA